MKRLFNFVTVTAIAASLFTGCISSPKPSESSNPTTKAETPANTTESNKPEEKTDTIASASISSDPATILKGLSAEGTWIFCTVSDATLTETLKVDGEFHDKADATKPLYRKLGLYAQDDKRNVTAEYTLTVPKIEVTSPNFRIQQGTVKGDVFVDADGFELEKSKLEGNLTFKTQAQKDSAKLANGTVTGQITVEGN